MRRLKSVFDKIQEQIMSKKIDINKHDGKKNEADMKVQQTENNAQMNAETQLPTANEDRRDNQALTNKAICTHSTRAQKIQLLKEKLTKYVVSSIHLAYLKMHGINAK